MRSQKGRKKAHKWTSIGVRVTVEEKEMIAAIIANTKIKSYNSYVRKALFGNKVNCYYRNESFDEFMDEMVTWKDFINIILDRELLSEDDALRLMKYQECIVEGVNKLFDLCMHTLTDPEAFQILSDITKKR